MSDQHRGVSLLVAGTLRGSNHEIPELRRQIGVVFQDYKLLRNKTVRKRRFCAQVSGEPGRRIKEIVPQVLRIVG